MEHIGSSFYLATNDDTLKTMESAIGIYKRWLGLSAPDSARIVLPELFQSQAQYFYQLMIKHLSILFEPRPITSTRPRLS